MILYVSVSCNYLTISALKQVIFDRTGQMGIKQSHLMCTFVICSESSLGMVVRISVTCN